MAKKQAVQEEQPIQGEQMKLVGLEHLDDETLARIAFQELARRSRHDIGR